MVHWLSRVDSWESAGLSAHASRTSLNIGIERDLSRRVAKQWHNLTLVCHAQCSARYCGAASHNRPLIWGGTRRTVHSDRQHWARKLAGPFTPLNTALRVGTWTCIAQTAARNYADWHRCILVVSWQTTERSWTARRRFRDSTVAPSQLYRHPPLTKRTPVHATRFYPEQRIRLICLFAME